MCDRRLTGCLGPIYASLMRHGVQWKHPYLEKRSCQLFCVHMAEKHDIAMLRKFLRKVLGISLRLRKFLRKVLGIRSTNAW